MKCPRCGLADRTPTPRCPGCGFSLESLDRRLGAPPAPPAPPGALFDCAGLLAERERASLEATIAASSTRGGGRIVVATMTTTAPVRAAEYAFWLFNRWNLAAPDCRGALILLALREQRVEVEAGYGWEQALNDLATGEALDASVLPLLREKRYADALAAAVEAIAALVSATTPRDGDAQ